MVICSRLEQGAGDGRVGETEERSKKYNKKIQHKLTEKK